MYKVIFYIIFICLTGCALLNHKEHKITPPSMESLQPVTTNSFTITGQILDWRAKPLLDTIVSAETSQGRAATTTTDDGSFSLQITQAETDPIIITIQSPLGEAEYTYSKFHNLSDPLQLDLMFCSDNTIEEFE